MACPTPFLSGRLSPVRLEFWRRPGDGSSTSVLRFNGHPPRACDDGLHRIAGLADTTIRSALHSAPGSHHQAPLVRFLPLQRSLAALRCPGWPHPRRSRFSLAPPATSYANGTRWQRWLLRFSANARVEISRPRPPRTSPRRPRCLWPPQRAVLPRGSRLGFATSSSLPLDDALGVLPFAVFIRPAGQPNVSIRLRPPAVHLNIHPGSAIFLSPGDRRFFCVGPKSGPAARQKNSVLKRPITDVRARLLGFTGSPAAPLRPFCRHGAVLPWALPLAGMRPPAGVRAASRMSRHAISAGNSASGSLRSWALAAIRSLRCAARSDVAGFASPMPPALQRLAVLTPG